MRRAWVEHAEKRSATLLDVLPLFRGEADRAYEPALDERVVGELRTAKARAPKVATHKPGAAEVRIREVATTKAAVFESGRTEVGTRKIDVVELHPSERVADEQAALLALCENPRERFSM
jgi:hypothetical protein